MFVHTYNCYKSNETELTMGKSTSNQENGLNQHLESEILLQAIKQVDILNIDSE